MADNGNRGIAFIAEGDTEVQFYDALLRHYAERRPTCKLVERRDKNFEKYYELTIPSGGRFIRLNSVGTITQICNSGSWFKNCCLAMRPHIPWTVFLCYDTDSYNADISKFHKGDWLVFRRTLIKLGAEKVIDLSAQADIEDLMLLDLHGISVYMQRGSDLTVDDIPTGRKGSSKMSRLFVQQRSLGCTSQVYHKGQRARKLIDCLNMDLIAQKTSIPLHAVEQECFPPDAD